MIIDLLMGLFRGAVFRHGRAPENCPSALMGRFPSSVDRFPSLMGRFAECLNGPFSLYPKYGCKGTVTTRFALIALVAWQY